METCSCWRDYRIEKFVFVLWEDDVEDSRSVDWRYIFVPFLFLFSPLLNTLFYYLLTNTHFYYFTKWTIFYSQIKMGIYQSTIFMIDNNLLTFQSNPNQSNYWIRPLRPKNKFVHQVYIQFFRLHFMIDFISFNIKIIKIHQSLFLFSNLLCSLSSTWSFVFAH